MTFDRPQIHRPSAAAAPMTAAAAGCIDEQSSEATVILNADDWGRDVETTNRILDCLVDEAISSVSAMVFMEDSERAADHALAHGVDAGLHLNFTLPFSAPQCPPRLIEHQRKLTRFLRSNRFTPMLYHPGLAASFDYVARAHVTSFSGYMALLRSEWMASPHASLPKCTDAKSVATGDRGAQKSFTHERRGGFINRHYREWQNRKLLQQHRMTDFFFDLRPLDSVQRFKRILELSLSFNVEVETHPVKSDEFKFLMDRQLIGYDATATIAPRYILRSEGFNLHAGSIR